VFVSVSPPSTRRKDRENRCPGCLFLDLELSEILEGVLRRPSDSKIDLMLTLNFNEQREDLPFGRIRFGLRGGELRLKLTNGNIPYRDREFNDSLTLKLDAEVEIGEDRESQSGVSGTYGEKSGVTAKRDRKTTETRKEKFQQTTSSVSTKGSEEEPVWVFEAYKSEPLLKGGLIEEKLATMAIASNPYKITATFEVSLKDIWLKTGEGIWLQELLPAGRELTPNKRFWIERRIILWLLRSKLQPYLSKVELAI